MSFGRLERKSAPAPMSDINMTPLIDVMLVLLVIFLVTAPLMASSLRLNLPEAGQAGAAEPPKALTVALDQNQQIFVGDQRVSRDELRQRAQQAAQTAPDTLVKLSADTTVPYGRVVELIAVLQDAGLHQVAFVTRPKETAP